MKGFHRLLLMFVHIFISPEIFVTASQQMCVLMLLHKGKSFQRMWIGMVPSDILFLIQFCKSNASCTLKAQYRIITRIGTLLLLVNQPNHLHHLCY